MKTQLRNDQNKERSRVVPQRRFSTLSILLALDAFALGGVVTLLLVNRLLHNQLVIYVPHSFAAADAILDFMDDLLPYYWVYGGGLLVLLLITANVWVWLVTKSELPRYGVVLLTLLVVVAISLWVWSGRGAVPPPPVTPTPVARASEVAMPSPLGPLGGRAERLTVIARMPRRGRCRLLS